VTDRKLELYLIQEEGRKRHYATARADEDGNWAGEGPIGGGKRRGMKVVAPAKNPPGPVECAAGKDKFLY